MTGVRFGRSVSVRAPSRADGSIPVATPGFASAIRGLNESGESPLLDARRLLPSASGATVAAPTPSEPTPLEGGATDYDVEFGRLRDGRTRRTATTSRSTARRVTARAWAAA